MKNPLLSTEEKRRWLARVFRDEDGEYSQADKFKALVEDTKLAALQQEEEEFKRQREISLDQTSSESFFFFNPRTPCGVRQTGGEITWTRCWFQSTHSLRSTTGLPDD